jgi:hypothetical protein
LITDSDHVPGSEIARESTRVVAEVATFDIPVRSEEANYREEARSPHDAEAHAVPAQTVQPERIAPSPRIETAAQPERPTERQRPVEAVRPIMDVPPISATLPPDSGLEIVETRFKPAPEPETEAVPAGRQRVRPPRVQVADEPLQIVETHKSEQPPAG